METIKFSVDVNVHFPEVIINALKNLSAPAQPAPAQPAPAQPAPAQPAPAQPAPAQPAPAQPAPAQPAPAQPAPASASSINIEDVRGMLSKKVNDHRETIKQKLTELGAPSVTKLDPSKYEELYNFLKAL